MLTLRRLGKCPLTSSFRSRTRPVSGISNPAIILRLVVLPHPLGPSSEKNSPSRMTTSTLSTATTSPKRLVMPSRWIPTSGVDTELAVMVPLLGEV